MDIETIAKRLAPLPWRKIAIALGGSFLGATVVSTIVAYVLAPTDPKKILGSETPRATVTIPEPTVTFEQSVVDEILKRNIFNSEGKLDDEKGQAKTGEELAITDLPIQVIGIIYGGDPFTGIALVENTTKKSSNSFLVGDQVESDATLDRIEIDRIILLRADGRKEIAILDRQDIVRSTRKKEGHAPRGRLVENVVLRQKLPARHLKSLDLTARVEISRCRLITKTSFSRPILLRCCRMQRHHQTWSMVS